MPTIALVLALMFLFLLVGEMLKDTQTSILNQARTNCPNGFKINEHCTEEIYGYECTNDSQEIVYTCLVKL